MRMLLVAAVVAAIVPSPASAQTTSTSKTKEDLKIDRARLNALLEGAKPGKDDQAVITTAAQYYVFRNAWVSEQAAPGELAKHHVAFSKEVMDRIDPPAKADKAP